MDTPHPKKPSRYLGRHRHPFLTRTVFAALATATVLGTGLTAASAAPPHDDAPAVAEESTGAKPESDPTIEPEPTPSEEESGSEKPDETKDKPKANDAEKQQPAWVVPSADGISDVFGPRGWRGGEMHNGLDFAAEEGDENFAAADGTVVQAGSNGGYGLSVTIDHGNGVETLYGHHSQLSVQVGDKVSAGDVIGLAGSTGDITGPHLHFEVHVDGEPVDPAAFLEKKGVEL